MTALPEREWEGETLAGSGDDDAFVVDVDGFAGPIDVLLSLARAQKVDLSRISIVTLADQYLAFVAEVRRRSLAVAAEYLVMAAWLAYLKSRLLLPCPPADADEPEPEIIAAALAKQLERLDAMRRAGARLLARPQLGRDVFLTPAPRPESAAVAAPPRLSAATCTLTDLLAAYARHLKRREPPRAVIAPLPLMSVDEAIARLRAGLGAAPGWESVMRYLPAEVLDGEAEPLAARAALAATFVGCLELARAGALRMRQSRPFGPIFILGLAAGETTCGEGDDG